MKNKCCCALLKEENEIIDISQNKIEIFNLIRISQINCYFS